VSRRRREMYIGHARLCVCSVGNGSGAPSCALFGGFAMGARVSLL